MLSDGIRGTGNWCWEFETTCDFTPETSLRHCLLATQWLDFLVQVVHIQLTTTKCGYSTQGCAAQRRSQQEQHKWLEIDLWVICFVRGVKSTPQGLLTTQKQRTASPFCLKCPNSSLRAKKEVKNVPLPSFHSFVFVPNQFCYSSHEISFGIPTFSPTPFTWGVLHPLEIFTSTYPLFSWNSTSFVTNSWAFFW